MFIWNESLNVVYRPYTRSIFKEQEGKSITFFAFQISLPISII